jgi:pSer/pThr/pTyr-binding forkhead associated (FHA) protein
MGPKGQEKTGMIRYTVYFNGEQVKVYELEEPVVFVGRLPENHIPISNMGISRRHVKIELDPSGGYALTDLNSLNGTLVNGKKVKKITLCSGDKITIGKYTIVYEDLRPVSAAHLETIIAEVRPEDLQRMAAAAGLKMPPPKTPILSNAAAPMNRIPVNNPPAGAPANQPLNTMPTINMPPVNMPTVNMPPVNTPPVNMPPVNMPPANTPPVNMPPVNMPPANMPPVNMPPANTPPVNMPPANMPPANTPPVNMPPVNIPPVNMPPVNVPPLNIVPISAHLSDGDGALNGAQAESGAVLIETSSHVVYRLDRGYLTVGSDEEDDIFATGFMVGKSFAVVEQRDGGFCISIQKAMSKIKVNGKSVKSHRLEHRDRIEIGSNTFRFMENG